MSVVSWIKSHTAIIVACAAGICLTAFVAAAAFLASSSQQLRQLSVLRDGLSICGPRANQSFVLAALGRQQSRYVAENFLANTEQCFGNLIDESEKTAQLRSGPWANLANAMASQVYTFHQRVRARPAASLPSLSEAYGEFEVARDEFRDQVRQSFLSYQGRAQVVTVIFWAGFLGLIPCLAGGAVFLWRNKILARSLEQRAKNEQEMPSGFVMDQLIKKALQGSGFPRLADLFNRYHGDLLEKASDTGYQEQAEVLHARPAGIGPLQKEAQPLQKSESLETAFDCAIRELSPRIQASGVAVRHNIDTGVQVQLDEEGLSFVLRGVMEFGLDHLDSVRQIETKARALGATAFIDIFFYGQAFPQWLVRTPLNVLKAKGKLTQSQNVVANLVTEAHGQIQFKEAGAGQSVAHIFISLPAGKAQQVSIIKGTKREVLQQLQA